ncbi:GtrA family protein [Lactococcus sp.]|uniref:GtrA family protein n=1 Tax=Lactococcus sp. TaxID=44273 RepID=UPI0035AFB05A
MVSKSVARERNQVELYFIWGVVTVAVNVFIFYILKSKLGMNYQLANFIDWVITVLFSFVVNKILVFKSTSTHVFTELFSYTLTRLFSFFIELVLLWLFISVIQSGSTISKVIAHSASLVINYFLSKLLFKKV